MIRSIAITLLALTLAGCAHVETGGRIVCQNQEAIQALIDSLAGDRTSERARKVFSYVRIVCPILLPEEARQ